MKRNVALTAATLAALLLGGCPSDVVTGDGNQDQSVKLATFVSDLMNDTSDSSEPTPLDALVEADDGSEDDYADVLARADAIIAAASDRSDGDAADLENEE
ncbi:MAG: hypothetical protein CHACPFDD_03656 [Phycisphaerae bacterium]|nr:hypothetical protein [Phycisphaerae bacterium]